MGEMQISALIAVPQPIDFTCAAFGDWAKRRLFYANWRESSVYGGERGIRESAGSQIIDLQMLTIQVNLAIRSIPGICVQICYSSVERQETVRTAYRGGFLKCQTMLRATALIFMTSHSTQFGRIGITTGPGGSELIVAGDEVPIGPLY